MTTTTIDLAPFADFLARGGAETWITSNRDDSMWHLGVAREARGPVSGRVLSTSYVTRCSGRSLGGAWGQSKNRGRPARDLCPRCVRLLDA